jgi:hypothetical protein
MIRKLIEYEDLHHLILSSGKRWHEPRLRPRHANLFYQYIRELGTDRTPYQTLEAAHTKEVTHDHWLAPRLVLRALMEECPEILLDRDEFYNVIDLCCSTVGVTSAQNLLVKFKPNPNKFGLPIVRSLTRDKYDAFTWTHKKTGLLQHKNVFPLKHLIPDWFTAFEQKCMKEHGY